jgi:hypothetical protein
VVFAVALCPSAAAGGNSNDSYLWKIYPLTATVVTSSGNGIPGDGILAAGSYGRDSYLPHCFDVISLEPQGIEIGVAEQESELDSLAGKFAEV